MRFVNIQKFKICNKIMHIARRIHKNMLKMYTFFLLNMIIIKNAKTLYIYVI